MPKDNLAPPQEEKDFHFWLYVDVALYKCKVERGIGNVISEKNWPHNETM